MDKSGKLLTDLDPAAIRALREDGTISGGMIPKLETCVAAVEAGVDAAVVIDGRVPHAMLLEIFTRAARDINSRLNPPPPAGGVSRRLTEGADGDVFCFVSSPSVALCAPPPPGGRGFDDCPSGGRIACL